MLSVKALQSHANEQHSTSLASTQISRHRRRSHSPSGGTPARAAGAQHQERQACAPRTIFFAGVTFRDVRGASTLSPSTIPTASRPSFGSTKPHSTRNFHPISNKENRSSVASIEATEEYNKTLSRQRWENGVEAPALGVIHCRNCVKIQSQVAGSSFPRIVESGRWIF